MWLLFLWDFRAFAPPKSQDLPGKPGILAMAENCLGSSDNSEISKRFWHLEIDLLKGLWCNNQYKSFCKATLGFSPQRVVQPAACKALLHPAVSLSVPSCFTLAFMPLLLCRLFAKKKKVYQSFSCHY